MDPINRPATTTRDLPLQHRPPQAGRTAQGLRRRWLRLRLSLRDHDPTFRRAFDVVVAACALVVLGPVLLVAMIAIKIQSRGPVFFRQARVGAHGRPFRMLKLRTMRLDAERVKAELMASQGGGQLRFKMQRDPRITSVGRILRKYSIDELPQLINVLRGDMTVIGPRPAIPSEVAQYDATALRRLEVPQGLTCLWQVGGRSDLSFEQQVQLDVRYVDTSDPKSDVKILLKTIPAVLSGRGAY